MGAASLSAATARAEILALAAWSADQHAEIRRHQTTYDNLAGH